MKTILGLILMACIGVFYGCDKKDTLVLATAAEFPPFEYKEGNQFKGIDIEIAQEIAKRLNKTLEIRDMEFDSVVTSVSTGNADLGISGLTINEVREKVLNFSSPYYSAAQVVVVRDDNHSAIDIGHDPDLLNAWIEQQEKIKIGVQTGTTGAFYASGDSDWGFKGFKNADVKNFVNGALAFSALVNKQIDMIIFDEMPAKILEKVNPGSKVLGAFLTQEKYGIGVNKSKTELLEQINHALEGMKDDGTLENIIKKYF